MSFHVPFICIFPSFSFHVASISFHFLSFSFEFPCVSFLFVSFPFIFLSFSFFFPSFFFALRKLWLPIKPDRHALDPLPRGRVRDCDVLGPALAQPWQWAACRGSRAAACRRRSSRRLRSPRRSLPPLLCLNPPPSPVTSVCVCLLGDHLASGILPRSCPQQAFDQNPNFPTPVEAALGPENQTALKKNSWRDAAEWLLRECGAILPERVAAAH